MPGNFPWNLPLSKHKPRQAELVGVYCFIAIVRNDPKNLCISRGRNSRHFKTGFNTPIPKKCQRSVWWHCDNNRMREDDHRRQGAETSWPYVVFVRPASRCQTRWLPTTTFLLQDKMDYNAIKLLFSSVQSHPDTCFNNLNSNLKWVPVCHCAILEANKSTA